MAAGGKWSLFSLRLPIVVVPRANPSAPSDSQLSFQNLHYDCNCWWRCIVLLAISTGIRWIVLFQTASHKLATFSPASSGGFIYFIIVSTTPAGARRQSKKPKSIFTAFLRSLNGHTDLCHFHDHQRAENCPARGGAPAGTVCRGPERMLY